jgi:hypothetical protein
VSLTLGDVVDRFLLDGHVREAAGAMARPPSPKSVMPRSAFFG